LIVYFLFIKFSFQENGKAPDGQTIAGEVMGPQRPRSNSGRELTDEVGLVFLLFLKT
jgi:hypothetical protein